MFNRRQLWQIVLRQLIKALVFILLALVIIYLLKGELARKQKSIAEERQLAFASSRQDAMARELSQQLAQHAALLALVERAKLKASEVDKLVNELEALAKKYNLQHTIKFETAVSKKPEKNNATTTTSVAATAKSVPVSLQLLGNGRQIISYLNDLEKLPYLFGLTQITLINSGKEKVWPEGTEAQIKGAVYLQLD